MSKKNKKNQVPNKGEVVIRAERRFADGTNNSASAQKEKTMDNEKKSEKKGIFGRAVAWVKGLFRKESKVVKAIMFLPRVTVAAVTYPAMVIYNTGKPVVRSIANAARIVYGYARRVLSPVLRLLAYVGLLAAACAAAIVLLWAAAPVLQFVLSVVAFLLFFRTLDWMSGLIGELADATLTAHDADDEEEVAPANAPIPAAATA